MLLNDIKTDVWNAQNRLEDAADDLQSAARRLEIIGRDRIIILPCSFGDRLWWCYDDDDDGQLPKDEQSDPIKGFLIEPGGRISATYDFICYDRIGGPDLWLTEDQAKAEQAWRLLQRNQTQAEETKEEKPDGSL